MGENTNLVQPVTSEKSYPQYSTNTVDNSKLPKPKTRVEEYLYAMCCLGINSRLEQPQSDEPQPEQPPIDKSPVEETPIENKTTYIKALLNSNANAQNYFSAFYDLGSERITEAKVKFRFILRNTGNDKPSSIGAKLFASNVEDRDDIRNSYCATYTTLQNNPEYDKEYTFEVPYVAVDSAQTNKRLDGYRYLKPFIVLNKTNEGLTSTHGVDIYEVTLTIGNETIDLTKTVKDFAPIQDGKSKIEIIDENKTSIVITKAPLPWEGKICNCLGDSLTFGLNPSNYSGQVSNTWANQLKELCGFSKVNNYGISASTITTKTSDTSWNSVRNPMVTRYASMENNADVIVVMGGTNDHTQAVPLGNYGSQDTNNFYGAVDKLCYNLKTKYPTKAIMFMLPMEYKTNSANSKTNSIVASLEQYREVIRKVCQFYSIPVFELYKELGFTVNFEPQKNLFIPDGIHPNQAGHDVMARKISKYINNIL